MNIKLEGKEIRQGNRFEYLGETVIGDGKLEAKVRKRSQVGTNVWSWVEAVMEDSKISMKSKGKVLVSL